MTREEKIKEAINRGYTCNPETGDIIGTRNKIIRSKNDRGYICIKFKINDRFETIKGHQFIWYWVHGEVVDCIDHINRDCGDNRISNLRAITRTENQYNRNNTRGYSYHKRDKKYQSYIVVNKKMLHLGMYDNEEEASIAYQNAKKKYHII